MLRGKEIQGFKTNITSKDFFFKQYYDKEFKAIIYRIAKHKLYRSFTKSHQFLLFTRLIILITVPGGFCKTLNNQISS